MRAIVLLFLLHTAAAQSSFSWSGPAASAPPAAPGDSMLCGNDPAACGCCLMQKQMNRLEDFFNMSINELNQQLASTKTILSNLKGSRTAFSVALNAQASLTCSGPFTNDRVLVYKHVFLNLGQNYDVSSGVFTAPRAGVYSLSVTAYSLAPFGMAQVMCANLLINGEAVASNLEKNGADDEDGNSVVVAQHLNVGDKVSVSLQKGCNVCDDASHYNTFTGFLLYSDNILSL